MTDADAGPGDDGGDEQRSRVRQRYGSLAESSGSSSSCCGETTDCCNDGEGDESADAAEHALALGYSRDALDAFDAAAELSLGCGNPTAITGIEPGETVLDLGSGGGFDCFLAGEEVGPDGAVIGVDMTPEMVERARTNAERNDASNVEFRLGEIEHLPVADERADRVISNCVINLSPDKPQVFHEAFRVLKPGGRLAVSDVVQTAPMPAEVRDDPDALSGCIAGAARVEDVERMLADAGFVDVRVEPKEESETFIREWSDDHDPSEYVRAAVIEARKPVTG